MQVHGSDEHVGARRVVTGIAARKRFLLFVDRQLFECRRIERRRAQGLAERAAALLKVGNFPFARIQRRLCGA